MRNKGNKEWSCGSHREALMGETSYATWSLAEQMWALEVLLWPQINFSHMQMLVWHPFLSVYFFNKITMQAGFPLLSLNTIMKSQSKRKLL